MKLYFVEYTVTAVVLAESEADAYAVAEDEQRDVFRDACDTAVQVVGEVKTTANLRDGWDMDCVPYGGDGNTRISGYLSGEPA